MRIEKYCDIYPLTIIRDRYNGTYSGGKYLAFNLDFDEIPQGVLLDDVTAMDFWYCHSKEYIVGKGSCIDEALDNLVELLNAEATEPRQTADCNRKESAMIGHDCLIGIIYSYDDTGTVTEKALKEHIKDKMSLQQYEKDLGIEPCKAYSLADYCDRRKSTDLFRFNYCPICAKKIEWDKIKQNATE